MYPYRDEESNIPIYSGKTAIAMHIINPVELSSKGKLVDLKQDFVRKEAVKL